MKIGQLGHVVLNVRDLQRSAGFYREVLGLREVARIRDIGIMFAGADNRTHHELLLLSAPDAPEAAPSRLGLNHIAWQVGTTDEELKAAVDELADRGVKIEHTVNHGDMTHSAYFKDPDGNTLEVFIDAQPEWWRTEPERISGAGAGKPLTL